MASTDSTVKERLRRLEDAEAVWQLLMDYKRELDRRDFAGFSRLFAEDGEWWGNLGRARGPEEIEQLLDRTLSPVAGNDYHLVTNPVIAVDGDRATAESTFVVISRDDEDRPYVRLMGHYSDVLTRRDGRWMFLQRRAQSDIPLRPLDSS